MIRYALIKINTEEPTISNINSNAAACNDSRLIAVDAMANISAISEENAAATEQTNASMEELNSTFALISDEARKLEQLASELSQTISYFND